MTDNPYIRDCEALDYIKKNADLNDPAPVDFAEHIMLRIRLETEQTASVFSRRRRRATFAVAIAISVALLSGFTYAASNRWLSIKDDSGREVMLVKKGEVSDPATDARNHRIATSVENRLKSGEGAHLLLGPEAIYALTNYDPKAFDNVIYLSNSIVATYKTTKELAPHLDSMHGKLDPLTALGDQLGDTKLVQAELIDELGKQGPPLEPAQWVVETDAVTGYPYAYHEYTATNSNGLYYNAVKYTYKNKEAVFTLFVMDQTMLYFTDDNPSADRIHEVSGTPVYSFDDSNGWISSLTWSQSNKSEGLTYMLESTPANTKMQLKFAKAVIEATKAGNVKR